MSLHFPFGRQHHVRSTQLHYLYDIIIANIIAISSINPLGDTGWSSDNLPVPSYRNHSQQPSFSCIRHLQAPQGLGHRICELAVRSLGSSPVCARCGYYCPGTRTNNSALISRLLDLEDRFFILFYFFASPFQVIIGIDPTSDWDSEYEVKND